MRPQQLNRILVVLYLASGAVGLLDEVLFFKYLSLVFGATAYASSAVLVAFMGGLALGAALAARFDARVKRPLLAYGVLEVAVGIACALSPWLTPTRAAWCTATSSRATSSSRETRSARRWSSSSTSA